MVKRGRNTRQITIEHSPTPTNKNKLLLMTFVLLIIIGFVGTSIDTTGEAVRKTPVKITTQLSQEKTIDGIRYLPTGITAKTPQGYLHAIILIDGTDTPLRANYKNIVSKAEYYVRYSEEDVQTMTYREVVNALKNTKKPLISLCDSKYADTDIKKLQPTNPASTTEYAIALILSDSVDPNKAISFLDGTIDCPWFVKKGACAAKKCSVKKDIMEKVWDDDGGYDGMGGYVWKRGTIIIDGKCEKNPRCWCDV